MSKVVWPRLCDYTSVVVAQCLKWSGSYYVDYTGGLVDWI